MKIRINVNQRHEVLIRDGFKEKHGRPLDETTDVLSYNELPTYLALGKKVKRRRAWNNFIDSWGAAIFWVIIIGVFIGWSSYSRHREHTQKAITSPTSSHSGITYEEDCPITTCDDGACSSSTGRGTCSHHGGIR